MGLPYDYPEIVCRRASREWIPAMRLNRKYNWVLLFLGIAIFAALAWNVKGTCENDLERSRERAANISRAYGEELQNDLEYGIQAAESLREMVWEKHGAVENFEPTARAMRRNSIGRLGLIRDGRMEYAYPEDIATERFKSLAQQEGIRSSAEHARKHRKAVLYGPMNFAGLGEGVVALKAIFVVGDSGKEEFWGYSVALINTPDVYVKTLNTMNSMGYDYCLDATIRPDSGQMVQIESSVGESGMLTDPTGYTFFKGQCKWRLNIMPQGGWRVKRISYVVIGSFGMWLGLMIQMYFLLHTLEADKRLEHLAHQDALTGVLNRQGFSMQAEKRVRQESDGLFTLVFMDLDDFKVINDVYGHTVGDAALKHLVAYLRSAFPGEALLGRYGGDEFCILIRGEESGKTDTMVKAAVSRRLNLTANGHQLTYTISAGYADYPSQADCYADLIARADEALYAAKMDGKQLACRYESRMHGMRRERLGFSVKTIAQGVPGSFLIVQAGGKMKILYANRDVVSLLGCSDYVDLISFSREHYVNLIHPEDRARVQQLARRMVQNNSRAQDFKSRANSNPIDEFMRYRLVSRDGTVFPVIDISRLVHDEHYGEVFFTFLFRASKNGFTAQNGQKLE